jgi:hypothetical protein
MIDFLDISGKEISKKNTSIPSGQDYSEDAKSPAIKKKEHGDGWKDYHLVGSDYADGLGDSSKSDGLEIM